MPKGAGFADILVPTLDTIRTSFLLEQLLLKGRHVLCVGETGTSKTVVIKDRLANKMPDNYDPIFMGPSHSHYHDLGIFSKLPPKLK